MGGVTVRRDPLGSLAEAPGGTVGRMRGRTVVLATGLALVAAGCTSAGSASPDGPAAASVSGPVTTVERSSATSTTVALALTRPDSVTLPVPTVPPATEAPPSTVATTRPPETAPPTTSPPTTSPSRCRPRPPRRRTPWGSVVAAATAPNQVLELGRSRQGRPIMAVERGTPGGTPVLVIGVIHGDEDAGVGVLEALATAAVPDGVDLWLVETMNPDGQAAQRRGNATGVDLNRNFPYGWGPIGSPGDCQYAGTGPASEPETQAIVAFIVLHPAGPHHLVPPGPLPPLAR